MVDASATKPKEHKFVLVGPDVGLTKEQIEILKKKFNDEIVTSLSSANAMSRGDVHKTIIVQTDCITLD